MGVLFVVDLAGGVALGQAALTRSSAGQGARRRPVTISMLITPTTNRSHTRWITGHDWSSPGFAGQHAVALVPHPELGRLTEREREIAAWVATGGSNDEIAAALTVSPDTVRTHVCRAMIKLHARDRAQLVVFALQSGLTMPEPQ